MVANGRWSLTRGGLTWRFDCIVRVENGRRDFHMLHGDTTRDTVASSYSFKTWDIFYLINALVELAFVIANVFLQLMAV